MVEVGSEGFGSEGFGTGEAGTGEADTAGVPAVSEEASVKVACEETFVGVEGS